MSTSRKIFFAGGSSLRFSEFLIAALGCACGINQIHAVPITPGDLVIYRVGTGAGALGATATAVFLDEYTVTGTLVQSLALPTTGGSALTAVGNATTEGIISRSQDGSTLIYTGYRKDAGGTSPASDTYTTTLRVIGTITTAGIADTTTTMINDNGATTANTIRSAASVSGTPGSALWVSTSTRVSYNGSGLGSSAGTTQIDARNSRQVNMSGNVLFASNGSTTVAGKVQHYGTLPTGATAATPVVTQALTDAVNGFALFDLSPSVPGDDTLYALQTVGGLLLKYTFDGSSWAANGSISTSAANLAGSVNGSTVDLYLTTGSSLLGLSDASGYGANITGSIATLATAGANTAFRGIGVIPEPSTICLALAGAVGFLIFRRRR